MSVTHSFMHFSLFLFSFSSPRLCEKLCRTESRIEKTQFQEEPRKMKEMNFFLSVSWIVFDGPIMSTNDDDGGGGGGAAQIKEANTSYGVVRDEAGLSSQKEMTFRS